MTVSSLQLIKYSKQSRLSQKLEALKWRLFKNEKVIFVYQRGI